MSSISITFENPGFGGVNQGTLTVVFNDGNRDLSLPLNLASNSFFGNFREIPFNGIDSDDDQATEYAAAFNRDYRNSGGFRNLNALAVGNVVTITAENGTFGNGSNYNGNVLIIGFEINNTVQQVQAELQVELTGIGDCDTVQYRITASGDGEPWRLGAGLTPIAQSWNGTQILYSFNRGTTQVLQLREPSPSLALLDEITLIVPRRLSIGEFVPRITQNIESSDVLIENTNPIANTTPLEYSLDVQGTTVAEGYQTSNVFPGVLPGFYELFIRDRFGCEVTTTIQVTVLQGPSQEQNPRYFDIPKGNSIIMSPCLDFDKDIKPNFNNTLSHNELSGIRYPITQYFNASDFEPIHFKSSYPWHVCTLHKCDGTKQELPLVLVQENRGSKEKVDCQLFPIEGRTGVYFDGGNQYEPDTTTAIGASPYTTFLPPWGIEGQLVQFGSSGTFPIVETGYDSTLQRGFFVVDFDVVSSRADTAQVIYNIQIYNVFECYVPFSSISKNARVVIERGFNDDGVTLIDGDPWASEILSVKENEDDDLFIEWSSSKNMADIVFFSGVHFTKRVKGRLRPVFPNASEIAEGDSRAYSIDQEFYQHYSLEIDRLTAREVFQLLVASKTDGFKVNGESLIKKAEASIEPLGDSNLYNFSCEYAFGENNSAIQPDSLALNSSTGVVGGGSTGKDGGGVLYDGRDRLNVDGGFVRIGEDFITI